MKELEVAQAEIEQLQQQLKDRNMQVRKEMIRSDKSQHDVGMYRKLTLFVI